MSEDRVKWTLDVIGQLERSRIGDPSRLSAIKSALENGRTVYDSDREYLKEKYKTLQEITSKKPSQESKNVTENIGTKISEPVEDDYSIMILKNRLAKGEISPQEFDILKTRLLGINTTENTQPSEKATKTKRTKLIDPGARYCAYCDRSVHPEKDFSVAALVVLLFLGIIPGLIYYFLKSPVCPICKHNQWTIPPDDDLN